MAYKDKSKGPREASDTVSEAAAAAEDHLSGVLSYKLEPVSVARLDSYPQISQTMGCLPQSDGSQSVLQHKSYFGTMIL